MSRLIFAVGSLLLLSQRACGTAAPGPYTNSTASSSAASTSESSSAYLQDDQLQATGASSSSEPTSSTLSSAATTGLDSSISSSTASVVTTANHTTIQPVGTGSGTAVSAYVSQSRNTSNSTSEESPLFLAALSCAEALRTFSSNIYKYGETGSATVPLTITTTLNATQWTDPSTTLLLGNITTYTLCDGMPRVDADSTTTIYTTAVYTRKVSTITTHTVSLPQSLQTAPCALDSRSCSALYSAYENPAYSDSSSPYWEPLVVFQWDLCPNFEEEMIWCELEAVSARLLYWPVTTVSGDLCLGNGSTITATPTGIGPNTIVTHGTTLTSPSVYVDVDIYFSSSHNGTETTGTSTLFIGYEPNAITTMCGVHEFSPTSGALNYADLNAPFPFSAWTCAHYVDCMANDSPSNKSAMSCTISGPLNPLLGPLPNFHDDVHTMLGTLYKTDCGFVGFVDGIWDPPHALTQGSTIETIAPITTATSSAQPTSQSASPASVITTSGPSATAKTSVLADPETASSRSASSSATAPSAGTQSGGAVGAAAAPSPAKSSSSSSSPNIGNVIASVLGLTSPSVASPVPVADPAGSGSTGGGDSKGVGASSSASAPDPIPANPQAVATLGSSSYTAVQDPTSSGVVVIAGSTLTAGGSAVVVNGATISAASNGVVVADPGAQDAQTVPFNAPAQSPSQQTAVFAVGGESHTAVQTVASGGEMVAIVDGSLTLTAGGAAITTGGSVISLASNGVVVAATGSQGGQTVPFSTPGQSAAPQAAVFAVGGESHTAVQTVASGGETVAVVDGSLTLTAGGAAITTGGSVISLASSGVVVTAAGGQGVQTVPFSTPAQDSAPTAVIIVGGESHTAVQTVSGGNTVAVVDGSLTLTAGGAAITTDGSIISMASNGIVVSATGRQGAQTIPFSVPAATGAEQQSLAVISANGHADTAIETVIGGKTVAILAGSLTLTAGGAAITTSGSVISLGSDGVVIAAATGTTTVPFSAASSEAGVQTQALFSANGHAITALETIVGGKTVAIVDGTLTLTAGGSAGTIGGSVVSLASDGGKIVFGTTTVAWETPTGSATGSAAGPATSGASGTSVRQATSGAVRRGSGGLRVALGFAAWMVARCFMTW